MMKCKTCNGTGQCGDRGTIAFGTEAEPRKVLIPDGVIGWRLRERVSDFARLYLKYPNRIEARMVVSLSDGSYVPGSLLGTNAHWLKHPRLKDDDGNWTYAKDTVEFCYGIPPVGVRAEIIERDGQLVGICPDHDPPEFNLRSLRRYVGNWYRVEQ